MKKTSLLVAGVALCALVVAPAPLAWAASPTIKKCRDATGKWHYGDEADAACANSKITVLSEQGVKKKVIEAPLTAEELKQREQQQAAAQEEKEQAKHDALLLSTYAH